MPKNMIVPVVNTTNYFISSDGYCIRIVNNREKKVPLLMSKGIPKVKIGMTRHRLLDLMIFHFIGVVSDNSRFIYKIIDNKMPLNKIKELKLPREKTKSSDDKIIFKYKCDSKASSANCRVDHSSKITKFDVLNALKITDFKCFYCGDTINSNNWHLDHVTPLSKGGVNTKTNIIAACRTCNIMKSDLDAAAFISKCKKITEISKMGV